METNNEEKRAYFLAMKSICPDISNDLFDEFTKTLEIKTFKKKEIIFPINTKQTSVGFIYKGLVSALYFDRDGNKKTAWFIAENEYITDYPSFLSESKSSYYFEANEDCTVVFLHKNDMNEAYEKYPSIQKYGRLVAEQIIAIQHQRLEGFLFSSAKERYANFIENFSQLIPRISQEQMASFLGIERQTLTRIRKEMLSEK
jgi:CRP/FNR family transcriptional regulator, anaerobic regulatory protein